MVAITAVFAKGPISEGQAQLNLGLGFSSWGVPVYAGLDFGLSRDVSLGAEVSYRSYREDYHDHKYDHSVTGISGNVNYHFNHILSIPEDWDFYAGANVGYYIVQKQDDYPGDYNSGLGLAGQVGARYYFTNSVGVNVEFGGGNAFSGGKLGLSIKL